MSHGKYIGENIKHDHEEVDLSPYTTNRAVGGILRKLSKGKGRY